MNPAKTYTLQEFIDVGTSIKISYDKSSILREVSDGIFMSSRNVIHDYKEILDEYSITIELTDDEYNKFIYQPRLLAYQLYGYTDMYFILMILNNISDVKEFTMRNVKILYPDNIDVIGRIINAEKSYIDDNRSNL